jgi:hypothetical protein|tara:strand:- start:135 stop:290 length:156 start_codon:yes stop_codon:yes gene_type:complete
LFKLNPLKISTHFNDGGNPVNSLQCLLLNANDIVNYLHLKELIDQHAVAKT